MSVDGTPLKSVVTRDPNADTTDMLEPRTVKIEPLKDAPLEKDRQFIDGILRTEMKMVVRSMRQRASRDTVKRIMEMAIKDQLLAMKSRGHMETLPRFRIRLQGNIARIQFNPDDVLVLKNFWEVRASKLDFTKEGLTNAEERSV